MRGMTLGMAMMFGRRGGHNKASAMQPKSAARMARKVVKKKPIMRLRKLK